MIKLFQSKQNVGSAQVGEEFHFKTVWNIHFAVVNFDMISKPIIYTQLLGSADFDASDMNKQLSIIASVTQGSNPVLNAKVE